jgi:SAM-dependent methyltransferase
MTQPALLHKHQSMLDQITHSIGDVAGMRVLDLGADIRGEMVAALRERLGVAEAVGVNPAVRAPVCGDGWQVTAADARALPFDDESFDRIISVAAFEHFHDLPIALAQAHRVLRPGGSLFSTFGPIWSGCWGHHLWINHRGDSYTFLNTVLPPYCHLLMERDEMRQWLRRRFNRLLADKAVAFIFDSPDQNRLFFDDYERIFGGSDFTVKHFAGGANVLRRADYAVAELEQAISAVERRFANRSGFEFDSITGLLAKE